MSTAINIKKNYTISLIRFIAMIFIITCHIFQYYGMELAWWFNVGVQMFFCISGFLYGNKKIDSPSKFVEKNYKKILIPYFCFIIPAIILFWNFHSNYINPSKIKYVFFTSMGIKGINHLWFISYILFCYLITPFLRDLAERMKKLKWPMFLIVFGLLTCLMSDVFAAFDLFFRFDRIYCYLFGYFAAVFMQNYKLSIFKGLTYILAVLTVIINIVRIYYSYVNPRISEKFDLFVKYAHAFLGISIVLLFIILLKNVKRCFLLDLSDKYSFYIYIVHQIFILGPFTLMDNTNSKILNIAIIILCILVSAIVLKFIADFVEKIFDIIINFVKSKILRCDNN